MCPDDDVGVPIERVDVSDVPLVKDAPSTSDANANERVQSSARASAQQPLGHRASRGRATFEPRARSRDAHAQNCGCMLCRKRLHEPERRSGEESDEEEGAVPKEVVRRERDERASRDRLTLERCSRLDTPRAITFWREFLSKATSGGNGLMPYWRTNSTPEPSGVKRPRDSELLLNSPESVQKPRRECATEGENTHS